MAFIFTCGTHTFTNQLKGYEHITARCTNCGNYSARLFKRWEWFTFCFVPIIPFSLKPYHDVGCHICNFFQDVKYRPDIQQMMNQGGNESGQIPMQPQQGQPGGGPGGPGPGPGYGGQGQGQGYGGQQQGYQPPPNQSGGGKPVYG